MLNLGWFFLLLAGIFEIGWPLGFKMSQVTSHRIFWILISIISMSLSGVFLWIAQRTIPIGTAYAIWTGIGVLGTFTIGIMYFDDTLSFFRLLSVLLILAGIVGLKLAH